VLVSVYLAYMRMLAIFILLTASLIAYAQTQTTVPVDQEPQHRVVFKNDFVRVLDATLPPGYVTLNHAHDVDNVSVTMATGRDGEGAGRGLGRASFAKGGYSHSVANSNSAVMRFIVVEVVKTDHPGAMSALLPHHTLETENNRVRIYRVKLGPGESLPAHSHPAGWVEVIITGGAPPGTSVWHDGGTSANLSASDAPLELVEIEPK
jgi:predicted metal-dependent enzyme (double-stranded beta helix superfamily)